MPYSKKGRSARAELTEAAVRGIRSKAALGASVRQLAEEYDVGFETVRRILRWETWRWVDEEGPGFVAPPIDPATIAASQERFLEKLRAAGLEVPVAASQPTGPAPTLEEALKAQALREEAAGSPGLERLAREQARPDALLEELTGQLDSNVVSSHNSGGKPPTSDGG